MMKYVAKTLTSIIIWMALFLGLWNHYGAISLWILFPLGLAVSFIVRVALEET